MEELHAHKRTPEHEAPKDGIQCILRCQGEQTVSDVASNRWQPHFNLTCRFLLVEGEVLSVIGFR